MTREYTEEELKLCRIGILSTFSSLQDEYNYGGSADVFLKGLQQNKEKYDLDLIADEIIAAYIKKTKKPLS